MGFSKGKMNFIPIEDILSKVSEVDIVAYYLNISSLPCIINSPLRQDKNPSFSIFLNSNNNILYKDFSTREAGNLWKLLGLMWNLDYEHTLEKVNNDLKHINSSLIKYSTTSVKRTPKVKMATINELQCRIRDWEVHDIEYWNSYGISLEWLKYAEVYPISHKIIVKGTNTYVFRADKFAYTYVEHKEGKVTLKIYQPYNKKGFKWSNKHDMSVISLWTKVPEYGEQICICSSLKDALCLWANTGIPALAVQGEGYNISDTAISELKRRYKKVYIAFDGDEAGIKDSITLQKTTNFKIIDCPLLERAKDWSDIYYYFGKEKLIKEFNIKLKESH